jgi:FSR family fosmidomycin resistance protein-like MFS transporter
MSARIRSGDLERSRPLTNNKTSGHFSLDLNLDRAAINSMKSQYFSNSKRLYLSGIYSCIILGIAHGIADTTAGFILGTLAVTLPLEEATWLIIVYNLAGFGYQPIAGWLTDKHHCPRRTVLIGLLLLLLALFALKWQLQLVVELAGLGSAAFHVGGGSLALAATPNRAAGPGFFTAPGVIGVAVGLALGAMGYAATLPLILSLGAMLAIVAFVPFPCVGQSRVSSTKEDYREIVILIGAIAIVSTVWTSFQLLWKADFKLLIILAIAAAIAKIFGAILADYWGWRCWLLVSLSGATLLFFSGQQNTVTLLLSLALLQSTVPITLAAIAQMMPKRPATATGFALGLAIFLGAIPVAVGSIIMVTPTGSIAGGLAIAAILPLLWVLRHQR